jgi:hypothetical protein
VPEGPRCEWRKTSFATRPFGHAAKKFPIARLENTVSNRDRHDRGTFHNIYLDPLRLRSNVSAGAALAHHFNSAGPLFLSEGILYMRSFFHRSSTKARNAKSVNQLPGTKIENLESRTLLSAGPDLSLAVASPTGVVAGTDATYVFTTTNIGKGVANPINYTFPVGLPSGCSQVSFTQTSGPLILRAGQSQVFTLVLAVNQSVAAATVLNFPIQVATPRDINAANNVVTVNTPVTASADVNIVVTGPAKVTRGTTVTFDLATVNAGPSTETSGYYTPPSAFPDGLTQLSYTLISGPGFALPAGDQDVYALVMSVPANIPDGTVASFPAVLTTGVPDPNLANNTATVSTIITSQPVAPVSIALTSSTFNSTSTLGEAVSFSTTITPLTAGATPTGTVTFTDDGTVLGTVDVAGDGTATLPETTALTGGNHTIIASYSGDGTYGATTRSITQVVTVPVPSTVVPVIGKVVLPTAVVSGAKFNAVIPVGITNNGSKQAGIFNIKLFANIGTTLDGNQVAVGTPIEKQLTLLTDRRAGFVFHLTSLPASLPAGTYHILAEVIDANGLINEVATTQTITTAAPFVSLSAGATAVLPASIKLNKTGSITVSITNSGNVNSTGLVTITVAPSVDGINPVAGVTLVTLASPRPTVIKPNKTAKFVLHIKHTALTASGSFYPYVTITYAGQTLTVKGTQLFTLV